MPFTLTMPKLSPTMEEGTLVKWHKKEGEFVKAGDTLFEIATDKATVEHNALDAGFLRKILVQEGKSALVNEPLAIFTENQTESIEGYQPEGVKKKEAALAPLPSHETSKVESKENKTLASTSSFEEPAFLPEPPLEQASFAFLGDEKDGRIIASPLAKKVAKEQGIDLSTIKGSGPRGRIVLEDLTLGQPNTVTTFGRRAAPSLPPGFYEEEPLSAMRKVIGKRLQESKTFIPHFYVVQEINVGPLSQLRSELAGNGIKLSFNDFVARATALALREHPEINSGFNSQKKAIIRFKTVDLAIAVSVPSGLITPIIRHADYKNVGQISQEIKWLASRAKEGKLQREEYAGGSFTLSNLGMFGISHFAAIINPPQAAILAVGGIEEKGIVQEGKVVPGKVMTLTVSADHRVIDGADVAKFLKTLQKHLEAPSILLLN